MQPTKQRKQFQLNQQQPQLNKQQAAQNPDQQIQPNAQNSQRTNEPENNQTFKASWGLIVLVFYLYFIQGIFLSIPATMPYVYQVLPDYTVLSVFSFAVMPFSLKFILAPFTQKFSRSSYGKRKFWVIIGQTCSSGIVLLASFFVGSQLALLFAILMFFTIFFLVLQGINLNALALKELRKPNIVSTVIATSQTLGNVLGSLALLKMTQQSFAKLVGLQNAITTPGIILRIFAGMGIIPIILMHFLYKERVIQEQSDVQKMSFCDILKQYRIFRDINSKYCRFVLLFLLYKQGYNFFIAGYEFQLVKNRGFDKDVLNTITNISQVVVSIFIGLIGSKLKKFGILRAFMTYLIFQQCLNLLTLILFPTWIPAVALNASLNTLLSSFSFLISAFIIYSFPVSGLSAMYISTFASAQNFGNDKFIQVKLTGIFGWHACAIFGLCLQGAIILLFPKIYKICKRGSDKPDIQIQERAQQTTTAQNDQTLQNRELEQLPKSAQISYQIELGQIKAPKFLDENWDKAEKKQDLLF